TPDVARSAALDRRFHWWCLAPTLAVLAVVTLLPTLYLLATSLTPLNLTQPRTAWDFSQPGRNYTFLAADGRLHGSFWVQLKLSAWTVGLQMLPQEMVDAARIDGAGAWRLTRHIVLPFLRGVLLVAALFRLIDSIKAFPLIFILTDGGPGTVTEVTNYYSYIQAFNFSYLGYSSAITVVLVSATVVLSAIIVRAVGWGPRSE